MTEPIFEAPVMPEARTSTEGEVSRRRGRPRSQVTLARDDAVVQALGDGSVKTRLQLAEELDEKTSLIYLALWRLSRASRVERVTDGAERHAWRLLG